MGNYKGNPDNYPIAVAEYDDSIPPDASQFNPAIEGAQDQIAYSGARALVAALVSLQATVSAGGPFTGVAPYGICWNDRPYESTSEVSAQAWLVTNYNAGINVFWTLGTDPTWTAIGGTIAAGNPARDIDVSLATGDIWVVETDAAHLNTWRNTPGTNFAVVAGNPVTTCTDGKLAPAPASSGSAMYVAAGSSTAGDAKLGNCQDTGPGVVNLGGAYTATTWILESNGSYGVAIPAQAAAGQQAYKSNADGSVWTGSVIGLGATDVPLSLCWNKVRGLWLLAVSVAGGIPTAFYTSPDGVTWTHTTTLNNLNDGGAVAAAGPVFFFLDNNGNATPVMRLLLSADGGTTWIAEPIRLIGTAPDNVPRLVVSPNMMVCACAVNPNNGAAGSGNMRFSNVNGMGDAPST